MQIRKRKESSSRTTQLKLVYDSLNLYIHAYDKSITITGIAREGKDTFKICLDKDELYLLRDAINHTLEKHKESRTFNSKDHESYYNTLNTKHNDKN